MENNQNNIHRNGDSCVLWRSDAQAHSQNKHGKIVK